MIQRHKPARLRLRPMRGAPSASVSRRGRPCGVPYRPERGHRETGMGDDKRGRRQASRPDDKRGRRQASPLRIGGSAPRRPEYEPFKSAAHWCSYATQVSTSGALKDSSALSTLNLRVSASASVQSARRHLEGISGIRREVPTTRMGRALARLAGGSRSAPCGVASAWSMPDTPAQPRLARNTPAATDAKI